MIALELITGLIPHIEPHHSAEKALDWMQELHLPHLPVVNSETKYLGLISEDLLLDLDTEPENIGKLQSQFLPYFVDENSHILEIINQLTQHKLSSIAVCNEQGDYKGIITHHFLLEQWAKNYSIHNTASIVEVAFTLQEHSLADLVRIVEAHQCPINQCLVKNVNEQTKVTLALQIEFAQNLCQAIERHGYEITYQQEPTPKIELLQERYQLLMKMLSI